MIKEIIESSLLFWHHAVGIVTRPYETYRDIEKRGRVGELFYIVLLVGLYFSLSSVVKIASFHPLLLSKYALVLSLAALSGYALMVSIFLLFGRLFSKKTDIVSMGVLWAYTLVPTVVWFLSTSLLYLIFPPPRTTHVTGVILSIVYLVISAMIFWWKLTLSYLALRFGLKIDLSKILIIAILLLPILSLWTYVMYTLGIYKVPFL